MIEYILGVMIAIVGLPVICYLCAKMGAYGALQGRYRFRKDHNEENKHEHEEAESQKKRKDSEC